MRVICDGNLGTVVVALPRHALGDEQIKVLRNKFPDVRAATWRGRDIADPDQPEMKMCHRTDDVAEVQKAGLPAASLCKKGKGMDAVLPPAL
jgi:hypothetical protein